MDSASMNPYEEQLYTVFKTFDVDNEEALDKSAVLDLCDALQLEDRGAALVDTLFERRADRVTFTQFRNGLLSVLSAPERVATPAVALSPESPSKGPAPALVAPHSDEDSSGREVAPKFVFGSKKYGRRSRPQRSLSASGASPRAASVSRLDSEDRNRTSQRMRCRRSASAMESRDLDSTNDEENVVLDNFDHDRRIDCDQALALCRNLRMDGIDRNLLEPIFGDSLTKELTVGDFFDRLNASLTSSIEGSRPAGTAAALVDEGSDEETGVASELVVDAWERAGVPRPRRLLLELGFAAAALRPQDLERVLDDELAALPEPLGERRDARATLLAAALALGRLRTARARRRADLAAAERDKLRADVAEANKRADLLAQDVDESHARMEAELAANLRRAEARHAEAARRAAEEAGVERERAAAARARLEAEVARRAEAEARARADADAERGRAARLEARALTAEERAAAAEREAVRLAEEARRVRLTGEGGAGADGGAGGGEGVVAELSARAEALRLEAAALRDRNDELVALLEARAPAAATTAHSGDLSAELRSLMAPEPLEECDSSPVSMEPKIIIDHLEAAKRLRNIFTNVRTLSPASGGKCDSCVATESLVLEICARVQELSEAVVIGNTGEGTDAAATAHSSTQTDFNAAVDTVTQTEPLPSRTETSTVTVDVKQGVNDSQENELALVVRKYEEEKRKDDETIRELEASLEQMRDEYERCEEYWARKLDDERVAHDDERRAGDERLAELLARVADYERSFAATRAPVLPPIEERAALEAQVADAEREVAECRARAAADLRARDEELRRLRAQTQTGQTGQPVQQSACAWCARGGLEAWLAAARAAGAREAAALRARAARAEAGVRRLTARLHAADLLVKDLYLENCHLAHRRAP